MVDPVVAAVAGSMVSDEEAVDELRAAWAAVSAGYARCWAAMAEVTRRTTTGWESAEIAAALTVTTRRADYELGCAQVLIDQLPGVCTALAAGELDHHKARVLTGYLADLPPAQAEWISARLVPLAPGWTTGQLAARLLREVQAIDPDYTRRSYQQAVREHPRPPSGPSGLGAPRNPSPTLPVTPSHATRCGVASRCECDWRLCTSGESGFMKHPRQLVRSALQDVHCVAAGH